MAHSDRNSQETAVGDGLRHLTLEELFHGRSPQEWRAAYTGAFNWGSDVGQEIVEEWVPRA